VTKLLEAGGKGAATILAELDKRLEKVTSE
jgi:hypothetical protein